jgi:curved DNA-binding protein CbpA
MIFSAGSRNCTKVPIYHYRLFSTSRALSARHRKRHYDILQIHHNADQKTIKSQYYKLSKLYHPDLNPNDKEAHEKFLDVNDAYAVLGNVSKRREYDMEVESSSASYSPGIRRTGPAATWNFKPRASRQTGSSSAQAQAEGFRATKSTNYNYNEWYARHYEAEEIRRRARLQRKLGRENHDAKFEPEDSTLWSRFWRLGVVIAGIIYVTQRVKGLTDEERASQ